MSSTAILTIKTEDGREFRVFCKNEKEREQVFIEATRSDSVVSVEKVMNGIHTAKEFLEIKEKIGL